MDRVTLRVPSELLADVEQLVDAGEYPNRSEAFRDALRRLDGVAEPHRVMTDGGREPEDGVQVSGDAPDVSPFVDAPEGFALTEVVREGDDAPNITREYLGMDLSSGEPMRRKVALIRGGATRETDRRIEFQMNEQDGVIRIITETSEDAANVLKTLLGKGDYTEVSRDE